MNGSRGRGRLRCSWLNGANDILKEKGKKIKRQKAAYEVVHVMVSKER